MPLAPRPEVIARVAGWCWSLTEPQVRAPLPHRELGSVRDAAPADAYSPRMAVDLGVWYRAGRERIVALVDDSVGSVPVPATPMWDVHDVIAHLAGICEDAVTGNMEGVTTDPWTAAQVERGRSKTMAELVAQWNEHAPMVEAVLSSPQGAAVARAVLDLHTHECDLLGALGRPIAVPSDVLEWIDGFVVDDFADEVAAAGLPPVRVVAPTIELFRSRLGRRTAAETRSYEWSVDPTPYLDHWFVFGVAEASLGEAVAS